ncbi:MAG TPA: hypothetical protein VGG57_18775 [Stellaceae bacterium]
MAQLIVRNLEEDVKAQLAECAHKHGMSLEELVRDILRAAAVDRHPSGGLGTRIASLFKDVGFKEGEIQEMRGFPIRPAKFDE